jgi:hypothetical protein
MDDERWTPISGWPGLFEVSSCGRIKSLQHRTSMDVGKDVLQERFLKQRHDKDGYMLVDLYKDGQKVTCKVHRLVADAFIENPENKPQVNHKDGNKANNAVSNLEWASDSENKVHRFTKLEKPKSKSGVYGVNWRADRGKWRAYLSVGGYTHLGLFSSKAEAISVLQKARQGL